MAQIDLERYSQTARRAAAEGCVLVRNEFNALPLEGQLRVAVFGRAQNNYYKSGTGSGGMVNTRHEVGILDALKATSTLHLDQELLARYETWVAENPFDVGVGWAAEPWSQKELPVGSSLAEQIAQRNDAALVLLGRSAGEDKDAAEVPGSYLLQAEEEQLLEVVCEAFKRTIVILNVGNVIDMKWVARYRPAAVLYAWHGGQEGGDGVVDVLTGAVNPSGRLPDSIAIDLKDYPSHANFGDLKRNVYEEDIFVGYRYFETFAPDKVLYPFGFGLSYTSFCHELTASSFPRPNADSRVSLTVKVTNAGPRRGQEVAQLYVEAPQGTLGRPARELKAFFKTNELDSQASQTWMFCVPWADLAAYDDDGSTGHRYAWVIEPGNYRFWLGSDVRSAKLVASVRVEQFTLIEQLTEACAPREPYQRWKARPSGDTVSLVREPGPVRTIDLAARIRSAQGPTPRATGDQGFRLADVLEKRIGWDEFLGQMTNEELAPIFRGEGMSSPKVTPGTAGAFGGVTPTLQSFGIPIACCADGPSGIRMDCGTKAFSLPNGTCLASTFNVELVQELYGFLGQELRRHRIDAILGPGMNLHRHPLNGRNFEYFSEDPRLTGTMAVACLRGLHESGVEGTIKHFAANNQEAGRRTSDSVISERALRELYLKGFEMAVKEGQAQTIMTTYGALNGIWTAGNFDLVTTILRDQWGFEGLVMTDWWADMNEDGNPKATMRNTHLMVRAQNDLFMVVKDSEANPLNDHLAEGVEAGTVTRSDYLRSAANICRVLMKLPTMERFLGRGEPDQESPAENEESPPFDLIYQKIGKEFRLDLSQLRAGKGETSLFGLFFEEQAFYDLTIRLRSDSGAVAQIPVSLFTDGKLLGTVTLQGNGEWVEQTFDIGLAFNPTVYLKVYFAQGGVEVGEICLRHRQAFDSSKLFGGVNA